MKEDHLKYLKTLSPTDEKIYSLRDLQRALQIHEGMVEEDLEGRLYFHVFIAALGGIFLAPVIYSIIPWTIVAYLATAGTLTLSMFLSRTLMKKVKELKEEKK